MDALRKFGQALVVGAASCALVFGALTATGSQSEAMPIGPLCGPTLQWSCSGIGGPDILYVGTVCDKIRFEKKTGLTCVPFGG